MKIYHHIEEMKASAKPIVATIGLFDGLHKGHQHLIKATQEMAHRLSAESLVVTMDKHPLALLRPDLPRPHTLYSMDQKERLIAQLGVDHLLILPFTKELAALSATQFAQPLIERGVIGMKLGYDNRFGRKETPDLTTPQFDERLTQLGLQIERVTPFQMGDAVVSSSRIREAIAHNDLSTAEALLGRPFSITGRVKAGRQIGRTIGFPTANLIPYDPSLTLPEEGVYISEVRLEDRIYPAMSYYGSTPTITPEGIPLNRIEAYLLNFQGDLYDKEIEVAFRAFIRADQKFASLQELQAQLQKDLSTTRTFFSHHPYTLGQ